MGLNVTMMGAPGAGKGTQAEWLARRRGLLKISTGDILREAIKARHPVGRAAKKQMDRGELIDDPTMIAIVRRRLWQPDTRPGFVLDGFPRTVTQAEALDGIVRERDNGPLLIVNLMVPDEDLVRRLAGRRVCTNCGTNADPPSKFQRCQKCGAVMAKRADDHEDIVLKRLTVYHTATLPMLEFYRQRSTFRAVNGAQELARVGRELEAMIDQAVDTTTGAATAAQPARCLG